LGALKLNGGIIGGGKAGGRFADGCCWKVVVGAGGGWIVLKDGIDVEGTALGAVFAADELSVISPKCLQ
jgi:hypothetical protein